MDEKLPSWDMIDAKGITTNDAPSHPFTPDVVARAKLLVKGRDLANSRRAKKGWKLLKDTMALKAARQIIAAVGRG